MRASPRDDAAARAASARGHGLLCASGAHEVILFGRAIGSWLRCSSACGRLLLLHLASVGARCRCAPDCTVAVKDMRGQSSGRRGQIGKTVCDAGAFAVGLSSFVHTDRLVGSVWTDVCANRCCRWSFSSNRAAPWRSSISSRSSRRAARASSGRACRRRTACALDFACQ